MQVSTAVALLAAAAAQAAPTAAPTEDPRAVEARKACAAGKVELGIELLADIIAESSNPYAIYNQARCYQQNRRPEEAVSRFREYLRMAPDVSAAERQQVMGFIGELEAEMQVNARRAAMAATPAPAASAAVPPNEGAAVVSSSPPWNRAQTLRLGAMGSAAVAGLGIIGGAIFGWRTQQLEREIEQGMPRIDRVTYDQISRRGQSAQTLQWVGYGVGAAAMGGAAVLYWFSRQPQAASTANISGLFSQEAAVVAVQGRF